MFHLPFSLMYEWLVFFKYFSVTNETLLYVIINHKKKFLTGKYQ